MGKARRVVGIVGVLIAVAGAGCGNADSGASNTTEPDPDAGASDRPTTTTTPALPAALPTPVCELVDRGAMSALVGGGNVIVGDIRASQLAVPAYDVCRLDVIAEDGALSWFSVGVSVVPADADALAAARADEPEPVQDVTGVGDGGFGNDSFVVILAGGRLVEVASGLTSGSETFAIYSGIAGLVAPHVAELGPIPLAVTEPACEAAAVEAGALLGGPPTIRRDDQEGASLICGWADADSSAWIDCYTDGVAADAVNAQLEYKPDGRPVDVGDVSLYSATSATIDFSVGPTKHCIVGASPPAGQPEAGLLALAQRAVLLID